jgi:hypothetical protein
MKSLSAVVVLIPILLAACGPANKPVQEQAALTAPAAAVVTGTPSPSVTLTSTQTATATPTPRPTRTPRPTPTSTPTASAQPGTLYLSQHLEGGRGDAYIPAPGIEGLTTRIGPDGRSVEYIDGEGKPVLIADARQLSLQNNDGDGEKTYLKAILDELYGKHSLYYRVSTYPRFRFPVSGVRAAFYGIDRTLTYPQILQMHETLELFERPEFKPFQESILNDRVSYIVIERLGTDAFGQNYIGTGIVLLDRKNLFDNKYLLAMAIAHEGSHVLQKYPDTNVSCSELLRGEVGDQTIPEGFENWDAGQVIRAIESRSIGAYHVSYWMLTQLGFNNLDLMRQIIYSGNVYGQPVVDCEF